MGGSAEERAARKREREQNARERVPPARLGVEDRARLGFEPAWDKEQEKSLKKDGGAKRTKKPKTMLRTDDEDVVELPTTIAGAEAAAELAAMRLNQEPTGLVSSILLHKHAFRDELGRVFRVTQSVCVARSEPCCSCRARESHAPRSPLTLTPCRSRAGGA